MTATAGHFALLLALSTALVLGVLPLLGAARQRADWMALARPCAALLALLVAVAYGCLTAAFVQHDFSLSYVAAHANRALPLPYLVGAVWGGHEGSMLLWLLMLAGWTLAVAACSRSLPPDFVARVLAVMGLLAAGLLLFVLATSHPFERLSPAPADGADLNPLLQDPGMVLHPPMLYMGYVGLSVAFAFAIAALLGGRLDAAWARWTRPWTTAAWASLTIGIALGSGWAYYELGWGGWWFWDPVENASFMPWLAATALIHTLAVTEKRNAFKAWTVLLAILSFSLSLLGTFLVRSGVLSSVHSFASDPRRGLFILGFLVLVVGGSLALYAWRAPSMGLGQRFAGFSRESALLLNNVLLTAAAGAVLLGTLYPLLLDALDLGRISVGPPYFDSVFAWLMGPLVVVMGVGVPMRWKQDEPKALWLRLRWPALGVVLAALACAMLAGGMSPAALAGLAMGWWIVASLLVDLRGRTWQGGLRRMPRAHAGMLLAHLGVAVFCFGVTLARALDAERDVQLAPGQYAELAGWRFELQQLREAEGPNYRALRAQVAVSRDGQPVAELHPEKRLYAGRPDPMTEAAIHSTPLRDLYVSLGDPAGQGAWSLRLQVKPFVTWIWGGCALMALGGVLAASDRRYRRERRSAAPQAAPLPLAARPVGDEA
jgi:cytochrome c-type biogenesis protein CcmF